MKESSGHSSSGRSLISSNPEVGLKKHAGTDGVPRLGGIYNDKVEAPNQL